MIKNKRTSKTTKISKPPQTPKAPAKTALKKTLRKKVDKKSPSRTKRKHGTVSTGATGASAKKTYKDTQQRKVSRLRQKAGVRLKSQPDTDMKTIPAKDARRLVHELRVYQIELEMQNDELRLAQEELEASRLKYTDLYDFAPVSYFTFDKNGLILEANLTGAALLGCARSRLIKKPFSIFIDRDYRDMFHLHCKDVFDASDRQTSEIKIRKKDGSVFYAQMESIRVEDPQGKKSCRSSVIDITGRKQAEEALKKVYDELETRIEARTSELKRTNERLLKEAAERKQTEKALRVSRNKLRSMYDTITKSEQAYKTLIKNIPGLVYRVHTRENNRIQFFNKASETLTGYKDHELSCGEICSIESCMYPEDRPKVIGVLKDAIAAGLPFSVEYRFTHKDGCIKYFIENGIPIKDVDGKLLYIDGIILDITRRRQAEEELRKFKFISDQSNDAHFLTDRDARFRYVNKRACRMLGYTEDELLSLSVPDVDIVYDLEKYRQLFDLTQRENVMPIETLNKRKDGSVFPAEITLNGYVLGDVPHMFAALRDISDRKRADETIKASLKEKEALLQEIHHRVKNNMQVISSLLNLQSQYIKNRESAELFKESQNRIKSMALIHEKLYLSEDMARIDFIAYIKNLADSLFAFYGANGRRIALHVSGGDAVFRIETAIPCGLIINELLSNSLKYAFPDNGEGKIIISIYPISENMFELTVSDNGIGIPEDIDVRNTKSLGLKLVEILTAQIHGEMELIRENGTTFRITFNKGKT